jgi:ApbE superfamily uncharacterized protein (UPF0280 family)
LNALTAFPTALLAPAPRCFSKQHMQSQHRYRIFSYKGARYRIASPAFDTIMEEIKRLRNELETYLQSDPDFATSLVPIDAGPQAPPAARIMADAARTAGVGPMAAVAGTFAEQAARRAIADGVDEVIVDNGGDIFILSPRPVVVGFFAQGSSLSGRLAFHVTPEEMPLALCSSSGTMGHSFSQGRCDLALVAAKNAALADAVATRAANLVTSTADIDKALRILEMIEGVGGVFILKDESVGMTGTLPDLIKHGDDRLTKKIPAHKSWQGLFSL